MADAIPTFKKPEEVILYAQKETGFDHRKKVDSSLLDIYEGSLRSEFPQFANEISTFTESPFSTRETLALWDKRLVSNVLYYHIRPILQCLTYVNNPKVVCEIGGGYGAQARLWVQNSIHRPSTYLIVDIPESLYFAETYLLSNINNLPMLYVENPAQLDVHVLEQYSIILCPLPNLVALSGLNFDLCMNIGSFQEMPDEWVDFWMEWIGQTDCRYFYSMNYFAQPLSSLGNAASTYSPRLPAEWSARMLTAEPPLIKMQSTYNWAEILFEKLDNRVAITSGKASTRYDITRNRVLHSQNLLEALDIIREFPDEEIIYDLLIRCTMERRVIPKESLFLAKWLDKNASSSFRKEHGLELKNILYRLHQVQCQGIELDMVSEAVDLGA